MTLTRSTYFMSVIEDDDDDVVVMTYESARQHDCAPLTQYNRMAKKHRTLVLTTLCVIISM